MAEKKHSRIEQLRTKLGLREILTSDVVDLVKSVFLEREIPINQDQTDRIARKIAEIKDYQPRVAVFGKTGAGKSSLCNAIFGQDVAPVSNIAACTREPNEYLLKLHPSRPIILVDVPGVGETDDRDIEYAKLYASLLPKVDLVLWLVKSDDRALASDQRIWDQSIRQFVTDNCPCLIVINQVDKLNPMREWDLDRNRPGPQQLLQIEQRTHLLGETFGVSPNYIVPVSALEKYNISTLVEAIVLALPNEKKYPFVRAVLESEVSEVAQQEAERGFLAAVGEVLKQVVENVEPYIPTIIRWLRALFVG